MVDQTQKFLDKMSPKQRAEIIRIGDLILAGKLAGLDILKLKGSDDLFRVRKGNIRIIFRHLGDHRNEVLAIENRSESTYRKF